MILRPSASGSEMVTYLGRWLSRPCRSIGGVPWQYHQPVGYEVWEWVARFLVWLVSWPWSAEVGWWITSAALPTESSQMTACEQCWGALSEDRKDRRGPSSPHTITVKRAKTPGTAAVEGEGEGHSAAETFLEVTPRGVRKWWRTLLRQWVSKYDQSCASCLGQHHSQMPRHIISDTHEWMNEIPIVPIHYIAKPQTV